MGPKNIFYIKRIIAIFITLISLYFLYMSIKINSGILSITMSSVYSITGIWVILTSKK